MAYNKKQALIANINAIETAFKIRQENRPATEAEKTVLREYSGFGGLGVIMNDTEDLSRWSKDDLKLLPAVTHLWDVVHQYAQSMQEEKELRASLNNSVLTAFYTPEDFISILGKSLYKAMGTLPEKMLEPSAGNGRFLHLFDGIEGADNIRRVAFEKDRITGLVLQALESNTQVNIRGFETVEPHTQGSYDLVVSNIPFADVKVFDPDFVRSKDAQKKEAAGKLHTYFFAKALDMVKDGGLIAFITSRGVAEAPGNRGVREYMVKHADLLSGIRLPDNLFADDGITSVGTDLLVFQRNDNKQELSETDRLFIQTLDYELVNVGVGMEIIVPNTDVTHARNGYFAQPFTIEDMAEKRHGLGMPEGTTDRFGKPAVQWSMDQLVGLGGAQSWQQELERMLDRDLSLTYRQPVRKAGNVETPQERTDRTLAGEQMSLYDLFGFSEEERSQIKRTGRSKGSRKRNTGGQTGAAAITDKKENVPVPFEKAEPAYSTLYDHYKAGMLCENKGEAGILDIEQGTGNWMFRKADWYTPEEAEMVKAYTAVRDTYWMLFDFERDMQRPHHELRKQLNELYDGLAARFGGLRSKEVSAACAADLGYKEVAALEKYTDGQRIKADIFDAPVSILSSEKGLIDNMTPHEALAASLNLFGGVEPEFLEQKTGKGFADLRNDLYDELLYDAVSNHWMEKNMLVCDNVYDKIQSFQLILDDLKSKLQKGEPYDGIETDIQETEHTLDILERSKPELIKFEELDFNLGERWIPMSYYNDFFRNFLGMDKFKLEYIPAEDAFHIEMDWNYKIRREWEVQGRNSTIECKDVFNAALVNNVPDVYYTTYNSQGDKIKVKDTDAMQLCAAKIETIRNAFEDWLTNLPIERKDALVQLYNERFNCFVRPKYDGSHQTFPGLSFDKFDYDDLYPSQKDAIWMIKQNGGGICDHEVGAGKTMIMCCAAMEMKRLGLANKPMIIALKANVGEIAATFRKAYPEARVLYPAKKDFEPKNRMELFRDIANNNYDCIILSHEQFDKIPQALEIQEEIFLQEKMDVVSSLDHLKKQDQLYDSRRMQKGLEKKLENLTVKLETLRMEINDRKDDAVDFRSMGIDHILVDESHQFKNLMVQTRQNRVAGLGNTKGSQRAMNLFFAVRDIQQRTGRDLGATFLSGTTISNSLTELYVLFKYLRPNALKRQDINCFDAWSAIFTRKSTEFEFNVTNQVVQKERFRYFVKVPELAQFYNQITDYRTADMIGIDRPKRNAIFKSIQPSADQEEYIQKLMKFASSGDGEVLGLGSLDSSKVQAKMLIATNLSNKMALDMRLIDPFKYQYTEGGKVDIAAETIYSYYIKYAEQKGTQFVFSDLGTYKPDEWNVYSAIKDKLVTKYGIPEDEIAFIQQHNTDNRKAAVIEKMNKGEVRVLFGSTQMLGTGVNAQRRAVALHHLDAPWRPSDLEQREGRAVRKGNIIAKEFAGNQVDIITYATERSLDAYKFNLLNNKQLFIQQLKSRQLGSRSLDEGAMDESSGVPFAEYVAILSGNTDLLDRAKLDKQVKQLERERMLYNRETSSLQYEQRECHAKIDRTRENIDNLHKDYQAYVAKKADNEGFVTQAGVGLMGEEVGRYVNSFKQMVARGQHVKVGTYMGMDFMAKSQMLSGNVRFYLKGLVSEDEFTQQEGVFPAKFMDGEDWIRQIAESLPGRADNLERVIAKTQNRIAEIGEMLSNRNWDKEDKLNELKVRLAVLDEKIRQSLAEQDKQGPAEDLKEGAVDAVVVDEPVTEDRQVSSVSGQAEVSETPADAVSAGQDNQTGYDIGVAKNVRIDTNVAGSIMLVAEINGNTVRRDINNNQRRLFVGNPSARVRIVETVFADVLKQLSAVEKSGKALQDAMDKHQQNKDKDSKDLSKVQAEVKLLAPGKFSLTVSHLSRSVDRELSRVDAQRFYMKEVTPLELAKELFPEFFAPQIGDNIFIESEPDHTPRRGFSESVTVPQDETKSLEIHQAETKAVVPETIGPDSDEEEVLGYFSQFINKDVVFTGDKPDVVIDQGNIFKVNLRHGINASRETVPSVTVFYKNPDRTWVSRMTVDWQDAGRIKLADGKVQQVQADSRGKETDSPEATRRFRR